MFFQLECSQQEELWKSLHLITFTSSSISVRFLQSRRKHMWEVSRYRQNLLIFGEIIIEEEPNKWKKIIGYWNKDTQKSKILHLSFVGISRWYQGRDFSKIVILSEFKQIFDVQALLTYTCPYLELLKPPTKCMCLHNVLLCIFR